MTGPPTSDDPWMKTDETAAYMRISPTTLDQWAWLKKGPRHVKAGGRRLYRKSDVDDWLEESASDRVVAR